MTKINRIVMHGFKSFAKRTELVFDNKFNCILGPNGSGKSNVLDAICFVLGKSSAKGLRAEKSSNLVYNGGKSNKPSKEGMVSIYFDNANKTFPSEEKEVKITRIVNKKGTSKYKVNDQVRTRTQVIDTLAIAKINPDGYNIVLQGDIIKFVELSSVDKRGMIEEISGISVYDEKKNKALRELEKVGGKLDEAEIILKERKNYLKDLKKERDQALKYKELNDAVKQNKASYLALQIDSNNKNKEKLETKKESYQKKFNSCQEKIKKFKSEIEEKRKQIKKISQEVEDKGEKENVNLQKEVEELRVEIATLKERVRSHEGELVRIKTRKEKVIIDLGDVKGKKGVIEEQISTLESRKSRRESEQKEIISKIDTFKKKHKLGDDNEEMDKKIDSLDYESEEVQKEILGLRERQQELLREQDRLEFQINAIDGKVEKVKEIEKEHKNEIENLQRKRKEFKSKTLELNKMLDRNSLISAEIKKVDTQLNIWREEESKLSARHAGMKEKSQANIAVQKILELKKEMPGIYGTVSELAEVSSKYGIALEVAAGGRIKSIVVKDDSIASKCIKYLRDRKLGIATFLPMNKIKAPEEPKGFSNIEKSGGSYGKAINLITFDPKFKKVFSYVFGNTIVVESLEAGRRIGVGKARMVTLKGDLLDISGSMKGGFRGAKKIGSFKEKELSSSLKDLEKNIASSEGMISSKRKEKDEIDEKIVKLREAKATLEGEIIRGEKGLHLDSEDLDASLEIKKELKLKIKEVEKESDGIISEISTHNRNLASLKVERQKLKEKLNELRNPRLLAELNTFDQKRGELTQEIITLEGQINTHKAKIKEIFSRDEENMQTLVKEIEKEEGKFSNKISELTTEISKMVETLAKKEKAQEEFYKKFKELFTKRTNINNNILSIEKSLDKISEESRTNELSLNGLSLEGANINAVLATLREEFAQYEGIELNKTKTEAELKKEIKDFERLKENIGHVNMRALEVYESVEKEYNSLVEKKEKLSGEKNDIILLIEEIEGKKKDLFMDTFNVINNNFSTIFSKLSSKGEAYLEMENRESPLEGGLLVRVRISGEKFMDLRSLSGGEKTLTSLAFIFAVQEYEPATFYVLDEVDAALDKRNAEKLAKLIESYSSDAQYVIISHNDAIISEASSLFGVSMGEGGVSKVVSLRV